MADPQKLNVLLYGEKIGSLTLDAAGYSFAYEPAAPPPHPLSLSLPLMPTTEIEKKQFQGDFAALPHYFENLIPEGWLLDVARALGGSQSSKLDTLWEICRDTLGAVSFSREGQNEADGDPAFSRSVATPYAGPKTQNSDYPLVCLRCARRLPHRGYNAGFHENCSILFFGTASPPEIDVDRQNLRSVAEDHLRRGESITGSQEKFSLKYKYRDRTMVVPGFSFIVKPRQLYPEIYDLPRSEHVLMSFARSLDLGVAETAFIKLRDGTDAFITRRFDRRQDGSKIHVEDLSQASGVRRGSEGRYHGSVELIAKTLENSLIEPIKAKESKDRLLKLTVFNFIFGNTDAHLKNHSIIWEKNPKGEFRFTLAPFYDLVPCLLYTKDHDEIGLKLGGKNSGLNRSAFDRFAEDRLGLPSSTISDFLSKIRHGRSHLIELMRDYEIKDARTADLLDLAAKRLAVLEPTRSAVKTIDSMDLMSETLPRPVGLQNEQIPLKSLQADPELCRSATCLNPAGRTRLKGARRQLGVCSYCERESRAAAQTSLK